MWTIVQQQPLVICYAYRYVMLFITRRNINKQHFYGIIFHSIFNHPPGSFVIFPGSLLQPFCYLRVWLTISWPVVTTNRHRLHDFKWCGMVAVHKHNCKVASRNAPFVWHMYSSLLISLDGVRFSSGVTLAVLRSHEIHVKTTSNIYVMKRLPIATAASPQPTPAPPKPVQRSKSPTAAPTQGPTTAPTQGPTAAAVDEEDPPSSEFGRSK